MAAGSRGPLKLPPHLRPVSANDAGAADDEPVESVQDQTAPARPGHPAGWDDSLVPDLEQLWDQACEVLDDVGLLAACDGLTLELALRHFLAARAASDMLVADGITVPAGDGSVKKNPAGAEFRAQSDLFERYSRQLGMSFGARARIPAKDDGGGEANPFSPTGS